MDYLRRNLVILLALMLPALVAAEPRGYRNHNPGNLVATEIPWQGKVACTNGETVHECFENDYYGLRAMALTLKSYMTTHGLVTIRGIMRRFSEFQGAGEAVARLSGIGIDTRLSVNDMDTMVALMQAIVIQENGYTKYTTADIMGVLYATYGANHFSGKHGAGGGPQDLGNEAAGRAGKAQHDDAGSRGPHGREGGDTGKHRQGIHMDSQNDCACDCVRGDSAAKSGGDSVPVPSGDSWVDRVGAGILAIQRWVGAARVARCEGTSDNSAGHASGVGYCWTLFWW